MIEEVEAEYEESSIRTNSIDFMSLGLTTFNPSAVKPSAVNLSSHQS